MLASRRKGLDDTPNTAHLKRRTVTVGVLHLDLQPQESQRVTILRLHRHHKERLFYVSSEGDALSTETKQDVKN